MPISVAAVREKVDVCTVEYEGETVSITYRSGATAALSPDERAHWEAQVARLQVGGSNMAQTQQLMAEMIVKFLVSWDVLADADEDGGAIYPLTVETVRVLEPTFLATVLEGFLTDFTKKKRSGTDASARSDAGSSPTGASTSSRISASRPRSTSASPRAGKASRPGS